MVVLAGIPSIGLQAERGVKPRGGGERRDDPFPRPRLSFVEEEFIAILRFEAPDKLGQYQPSTP